MHVYGVKTVCYVFAKGYMSHDCHSIWLLQHVLGHTASVKLSMLQRGARDAYPLKCVHELFG